MQVLFTVPPWVAWGKSFHFSVPRIPRLHNEGDWLECLQGLLISCCNRLWCLRAVLSRGDEQRVLPGMNIKAGAEAIPVSCCAVLSAATVSETPLQHLWAATDLFWVNSLARCHLPKVPLDVLRGLFSAWVEPSFASKWFLLGIVPGSMLRNLVPEIVIPPNSKFWN